MDSSFFPKGVPIENRHVLNIYINSLLQNDYTKNRDFSHFDRFPTLLDSIGVLYDSDGLGLGRSMSYGKKTLIEKFGQMSFDDKLKEKSNRYLSFFTEKYNNEDIKINMSY
jgi:phosphoglycerol transferase